MSNHTKTALSDLTVDFPTRPKMPALPGATDAHRHQGRMLAAIHRAHLWELARVGKVLKRIEAGDSPPEELSDIVLALDMAQNLRVFGSLCGQECRMLSFHHDAEEHALFPELEAAGHAALSALVARLRQEHEVVHELLRRLEDAAATLVDSPTDENLTETGAVFLQLETVVRSHFGYEEAELEEAIGLYGPDF